MKFYGGIGSRETPRDVFERMIAIGRKLAEAGYTLRSGGADGADSAFERGCDEVRGSKEIFLPWKGFNKHSSALCMPSQEAKNIAARIHPVWEQLSHGAKLLHARNIHQILGRNLQEPVEFVICWTMGGGIRGGTATAMKLATEHGIQVYNLYDALLPLPALLS